MSVEASKIIRIDIVDEEKVTMKCSFSCLTSTQPAYSLAECLCELCEALGQCQAPPLSSLNKHRPEELILLRHTSAYSHREKSDIKNKMSKFHGCTFRY